MKPIVTGALVGLTALSLTSNVLLYMRYSSSRPAVTVGSQVITKKQYQDALDYQTQGAVLRKLVFADMIEQASATAGVAPTTADVDARMADIQRRAPQQLPTDGPDGPQMQQFRQSVRDTLALENLRIKDVKLTDADVSAYYRAHRADFAVPVQVQTSMIVTDNTVDASQAANLLQQGIALDIIARQPRLHVVGQNGFSINWKAVPPAVNRKISDAVFRMKQNQVQVIPIAGSYLVIRATHSKASGTPPLGQIEAQVRRRAALEKAVPENVELAKLYQADKPSFGVAKYADYFNDLSSTDIADNAAATRTASTK
jgi:hypothetical protein